MNSPNPGIPPDANDGRSALRANTDFKSLLVYHHDGVEVIALVPDVRMTIGRAAAADITVRGAELSRMHAEIELSAGRVWIRDLASTYGTRINGQPTTERTPLQEQDEVQLGSVTVTISTLTPSEARRHGPDSHDRFQDAVEEEVVRARTFHRTTSVIMVKHTTGETQSELSVSRWVPRIRNLLREVDRIGLYGPALLEILYTEGSAHEATALAQRIARLPAAKGAGLVCGVACYPDGGRSGGELIAAAREAVQSASLDSPVKSLEQHDQVELYTAAAEGDGDRPVLMSATMQQLYRTAEYIASANIPVLVLGETGTGKEVLARTIHANSKRRDKPLHCINCGAIPSQLIQSALFGHERGSFTGAQRQQKGVFEAAEGGTVLLDEIGELPHPAQVALLRVLDSKTVQRVGSPQEFPVDVRILAATHRDLEAMCEAGTFRLDLYHRINAMTLQIPPLRERMEELPALANHFIKKANLENQRRIVSLTPEALEHMMRYPWPGNVREFRNVIDRAVVIALGERIDVQDLPERLREDALPAPGLPAFFAAPVNQMTDTSGMSSRRGSPTQDFRRVVLGCETALIESALTAHNNNQTQAAKALGMPRRTLVYKLRTLDLSAEASHVHRDTLASMTRPGDDQLSFRQRMEQIECRLLTDALSEAQGDASRAARLLKLQKRTFDAKRTRYQIP